MHDLPLDKKKLEDLVKKSKHYKVSPIDLPSYLRDAPQHPITDVLTDLVDAASEYLSFASNAEVESLLDSLPPGMAMMLGRKPEWKEEEQRRRIAVYYVASEVQRSHFPLQRVVNEDINSSEVLKVYPELRGRFDKDGLLHINCDFKLHDYGVEYKDHILQYHQLLRDRYMSYSNLGFLGRLISYYQQTSKANQFRLAIDHHRQIKPKEFYGQIAEFDTWYGLSFDPEKLDEPTSVGLTVVKRNKDSLFEQANSLDRTEFFWSYRDGIKTFEIEEISDDGQCFEHYYFNKYVHSERDIKRKITRHIDGAVKVYLQDSYSKHKNLHLPNKQSHKKIKLWRIDGDIDTEKWIELISFFYKGNEMIIEYFNPEEFEQMFELRVRDFKAWKRQQSDQGEDI